MNTQIIAIANQKGGVGKTTTCANLGVGLAQAGKKVLLIDGDPQGSLTISLGHPQPDKLPFTLSDAMGRILMDEPLKPGEGILHHPEGVDLMPADIQLSGMEVSLVNAMSRETILRQYLDTVKGQYSHILIDCQPSLGMLTVNALAAANTRLPSELSGGEQKRVAIARALAAEPQCLIFDEATNGFDLPLRKKIIDEIIDLQQQLGFTLIFITHDMELAAVVADEIFVMRNSNLVERAAFSGDYSVFHDPYSRMLLEASGLVDTSTEWNDKTKERIDLK